MKLIGNETGPYAIAYKTSINRPGVKLDGDGKGSWLITAGILKYAAGIGYQAK